MIEFLQTILQFIFKFAIVFESNLAIKRNGLSKKSARALGRDVILIRDTYTCRNIIMNMESKKESSCKIKEAIHLLSAALVDKEEDAACISNQPSLYETSTPSSAFRRDNRHKLYQLAAEL